MFHKQKFGKIDINIELYIFRRCGLYYLIFMINNNFNHELIFIFIYIVCNWISVTIYIFQSSLLKKIQ